jgi:glycosyltransferase involved in cell wall biosynthesis
VVFNPVDTKSIVPGHRNNGFRRRHQIGEEELIVSYAGILGYAQDLDSVIAAAAQMTTTCDVIFYIVGDGVEKSRLMKEGRGRKNIRFLPMLEKEEYLELLQASDVCLVTLQSSMKTPVVPAKIMSIMAAGRPLVGSMPLDGDAPKLIRDAGCGVCVEPGNVRDLAAAIKTVLENPSLAAQYSRSGRAYVEAHCSLEGCATAYERIFDEIIRRNDVRLS